jgi:hypothetical protein
MKNAALPSYHSSVMLANPTTLWPPNGKMVPVTVSGTITGKVSGVHASTASYAVIDEYGSVQPSSKVTLGSNGSYSFCHVRRQVYKTSAITAETPATVTQARNRSRTLSQGYSPRKIG